MKDVYISPVSNKDILQLIEIGKRTFIETFAAHNTEENMNSYLREAFDHERVTEELCDVNSAHYFASIGDEIVGYLKLNMGTSQTEIINEPSIEIERIYVVSAYHGKGVGRLLLDQAISVAHSRDVGYVWLGVWEENSRAIAFYKKHGFEILDQHTFILGTDHQTDLMMLLRIT